MGKRRERQGERCESERAREGVKDSKISIYILFVYNYIYVCVSVPAIQIPLPLEDC